MASASLVTKVYFPRMIIPGAPVLAALVDFCHRLRRAGVLMAWYGVPIAPRMLILPVLVALVDRARAGRGHCSLPALTVEYRDVRYALPFLVQFWMFATPIIFPSSIVPEAWRWALALNPMTGIVENFRAALFGPPLRTGRRSPPRPLVGGLVLVYAAYSFRRLERTFADMI